MRPIGRHACFETRPGYAGPLFSIRMLLIILTNRAHREALGEARPRRTYGILPGARRQFPSIPGYAKTIPGYGKKIPGFLTHIFG